MKKKGIILAAGAVLLVAAVLVVVFATRGGGNKASAMWLVRAEGSVSVTDGGGADVPVRSTEGLELRLGLYNGYAVGTRSESYGWINLDDTKLTKLDEDSAVTINRSGKELELVLDRGSLFFNVTKPLEDDETLEIRSSSMVMAVRDTCGWVRAVDSETFDVYIIEGKVRVTARTEDSVVPAVEQVAAGQTARLSISGGRPSVTLGSFDEGDVPEFVLDEAREDEEIAESFAAIGIDAPEGPSGPDDGPSGPEDVPPGADDGPDNNGETPAELSFEYTRVDPDPDLPGVFFYYPVFSGPEAADRINELMQARLQAFLQYCLEIKEDPNYEIIDRLAYDNNYSFFADMTRQGLVVLECMYSYKDGLGGDNAYSSITMMSFDIVTGADLDIVDLTGGTPQQVRQAIKAELEKTVDSALLSEDRLNALDLSQIIEYSFTGNELDVNFQLYLLGGSRGETAHITLPLAEKYGGKGFSEAPPAQGPADPDAIASGTGWSLSADGVLTVTPDYEGLDDLNWSDAPWAEYRQQVTGLVLGEGITSVNSDAFSHYSAVEELTLPESLVSIGSQAFSYMLKLRSLTLGDSVEYIGVGAFYSCDALTSVEIPRSVKKIESQAFSGCASLREITFLGPVEELINTVQNCSQLTTVNLPEGVKSLVMTFYECKALTGIDLPSTLTDVGSDAFACSGIRSLAVPEGVLTLSTRAFWNCAELTELWLPSTLTHIGDSAFADTPALETIHFAGTREQWERICGEDAALSDTVTVNCNG